MVRSLNVLMYQKGANTRLREMPPAPARLSRLNYSRQYVGWFLDREPSRSDLNICDQLRQTICKSGINRAVPIRKRGINRSV